MGEPVAPGRMYAQPHGVIITNKNRLNSNALSHTQRGTGAEIRIITEFPLMSSKPSFCALGIAAVFGLSGRVPFVNLSLRTRKISPVAGMD